MPIATGAVPDMTASMAGSTDIDPAHLGDEPAPHPYLSGVHVPMTDERTVLELSVTGTIPAGLHGRYLRIGPNPITPQPDGYHWFVGDGMVHGLSIKEGRALWYRNRWIRSRAVSLALGEPPIPGPRHRRSDNVNTNVLAIGGRTWALVEAGAYPVELREELDSEAHNPFDGTLTGSFTAHPHRDPLTGESHAIAYDALMPDRVRHVVLSDAGRVVRELSIPVENGPSIHDCAITARYVVVLDLPVTFSRDAAAAGERFPYEWNPAHRARVGLLPRTGTADDVIWCPVDPCFAFHTVNAYDRADGGVTLDLVAYDSMFASSRKGPDATGRLERWSISPETRSVERRVLDPSPQEFPRPDERRIGQSYRFAYAIQVADQDPRFSGGTSLYKHDLTAGIRETHEFGEGRLPGEFVFVPASPDAGEDEGWLIGLVVDLSLDTTDLVIIDARAFADEPVASVHIPHRIPAGFHGNWIASAPS